MKSGQSKPAPRRDHFRKHKAFTFSYPPLGIKADSDGWKKQQKEHLWPPVSVVFNVDCVCSQRPQTKGCPAECKQL